MSEYSKIDAAKKGELKLKMIQTLEWFSKQNSTESVVVKNSNQARIIINTIHTKSKTEQHF